MKSSMIEPLQIQSMESRKTWLNSMLTDSRYKILSLILKVHFFLQEKPPKFDEKGAIEVLLFDIQSQMRADNRVPWTPAEGKLIADVQKRWDELELAEHARELAIHEELKRQERLEQLAENFFTKAQMREEWLKDVRGLLEKGKELCILHCENFLKTVD